MKKEIFILFISFCFNTVFGQDVSTTLAKQIDSVQKIVDYQKPADTNTVIKLNLLANICFLNLQYERGLTAASEARMLAKRLNYGKGETMYLQVLAGFHMYTLLGRYYSVKIQLSHSNIDYLENITDFAIPDYTVDFIKKANARLLETLAFYEAKQDKELVAQILFRIVSTLLWLDKPTEALTYLNRSIDIFRELKEDGSVVHLLIVKMIYAKEMGEKQTTDENEKEVNKIISGIADFQDSALLTYSMNREYQFTYGKKSEAIRIDLEMENKLERTGENIFRVLVLENLAVNFGFVDMSQKSIEYYKQAIELREKINYFDDAIRIYLNVGFELVNMKKLNESKIYFSKAKELINKIKNRENRNDEMRRYDDASGQILMGEGKYKEALEIFKQTRSNAYVDFYIANCYYKLGNLKESIKYGEKSYEPGLSYGDQRLILKTVLLLSEVYEQTGQRDKAYRYLKKYQEIIKERDEENIANYSANLEIQSVIEKNQREKTLLEKEKLVKEKQNQNQRWWLISIGGALLSTFILLFVFYRNYHQKQKANHLLQQQKQKVEYTLQELKSTQAQLIQSEKMASLGQLTAGIAHEIQNPLNFVNNFSDVNNELIEELKTEALQGNTNEVVAIANDIKANEEKINHHGKRADEIVKGMLQHSRTSTGVKEPTDINALADEYLRLAYHGMRGKDKSFNATMQTDFDSSIGKINIVPQDIGRVLLNLYNNAFYAVNEMRKQQSNTYEPIVIVSSKAIKPPPGGGDLGVLISVKDNGNGIPHNIIDKIFQPFFTTKPTGQGTGLGLSLAYDIVKAHGGELKLDSLEGKETTFVVTLPVK